MKTHCKGCKYHSNAGHQDNSPLEKKYNDWCTKHSMVAAQAIGHCKLTRTKELK